MAAVEELYPGEVVAGIAAAAGITDPKKIREFEPPLVRWAEVTLRILEDNKLDSERTPIRLRRLAKRAEELDAGLTELRGVAAKAKALDAELTELMDDMDAEVLLWAEAQSHGPPTIGEPPPSETYDLGAYRIGNVQANVRDLITWAGDAIGVRSQVRAGPKNLRVRARERAVCELVPIYVELTGVRAHIGKHAYVGTDLEEISGHPTVTPDEA